jgi:phosphoribosylglycinamide formyltransferase-1
MSKIVILASGAGSNANEIIKNFKNRVCLVATNNSSAGVIHIAKTNNIPVYLIAKENFENDFYNTLHTINPDLVVLAGFLWKIPSKLIQLLPNKIINIHPSLLPKFGGHGMYGHKVHESVFASRETETGITIHYVNENYDEGQIIKQYKTNILPEDKPYDIESKVRKLEIKYYSKVIQDILKNN